MHGKNCDLTMIPISSAHVRVISTNYIFKKLDFLIGKYENCLLAINI